MSEQEWKPNKLKLEPVSIPAFTAYEPCVWCAGKGWKKEKGGYSMITCPICGGAKKLPVSNADGQFLKRGQRL